MKKRKITYYVILILFSCAILFSVYNYIFNYDDVVQEFNNLGYPDHLVGIIALGQIMGLMTIIRNKGKSITEWAYTGFFINFICAFFAHFFSKHGNGAAAILFIILLGALYILNKLCQSEIIKTGKIIRV